MCSNCICMINTKVTFRPGKKFADVYMRNKKSVLLGQQHIWFFLNEQQQTFWINQDLVETKNKYVDQRTTKCIVVPKKYWLFQEKFCFNNQNLVGTRKKCELENI